MLAPKERWLTTLVPCSPSSLLYATTSCTPLRPSPQAGIEYVTEGISQHVKSKNGDADRDALKDGHLKLATIAWCNVFGSHTEDLYWTKTPVGDTVEQAREDFRFRVLPKTGFAQKKWEDYHKTMLAMRDTYVAHLNVEDPISKVPLFDAALLVAYVYLGWVRPVIEPVIMSNYPLSAEYARWKAEASSIVSTYASS